jgi:3-hydroxyisobutyrate dehydrogenase-like beta-hydroxyacid dehydrogenase
MDSRVAILGTGRMGSAIAQRLAEGGAELTLWNRTGDRASKLAERLGLGLPAASPADAAAGADLVISSLTGPGAVRSTYEVEGGALEGAHGQVFVEMSTAGPEVVAELVPLLAARGSILLDAPIMGAPTAVLRGEAAMLIGGEPAGVEAARPTLARLGDVRHVGPSGSGARLKLVANSMLGVVTLAAAELQSAGGAAGLGPEDVFWVLARLCPALNARRDGYLRGAHTPTLFAVRDLIKDLDLALALFHSSGSSMPLVGIARELIHEVEADAADLDISAVAGRYPRAPSDVAGVRRGR